MKHETLKKIKIRSYSPRPHASCFMFYDPRGYAAMFSFLVMTIVLGGLMSVFAVLVFKSVFLARTSAIEFKNIYAAEGFAEDVLKRARDAGLADVADGETLEVGEAAATVSLSSQGSVKNHAFSAQTGQKYFISEILTVDGSGPSAKIKKWQDTQ